ncbi:ABC transporter permease [Paraconexibacter sp.]|uniref:ABC transporter permease n=1 Tax=Paraconexibacter sp. TaxID=2949640 RepID=UPI0035689ADB
MSAVTRATRRRTVALGVWSGFALLYLFLPVFLIVAFSFNDPSGRFNFTWQGFTLDQWKDPFSVEGLGTAFRNSLEIAALSVVVSVILGTLVALALARYHFRGRSPLGLFLFLPLATPDVVMGASLLGLFLTMNVATGFATILIAHVMFNIAYVVVTVLARLQGMDAHLEEAAMDLGANEWTTFRLVTLPLIAPGVAAAAMLAFVLSIDDYIVTSFNAGTTSTFPLYIFGAARQGVPPQVNVLATALLFAVVLLMVGNVAYQRRLARRDAAA